jgi:hypothetical protein
MMVSDCELAEKWPSLKTAPAPTSAPSAPPTHETGKTGETGSANRLPLGWLGGAAVWLKVRDGMDPQQLGARLDGQPLATERRTHNGMVFLTAVIPQIEAGGSAPDSVTLQETVSDLYNWSCAGTDGVFTDANSAYFVSLSSNGLVEKTFDLQMTAAGNCDRVFLPVVSK